MRVVTGSKTSFACPSNDYAYLRFKDEEEFFTNHVVKFCFNVFGAREVQIFMRSRGSNKGHSVTEVYTDGLSSKLNSNKSVKCVFHWINV